MIINFKINFDRIEGFVNLDRAFKDEIKEKILSDLPVYKFAKKVEITSVSIGYFLNKDNSFISIKHLVEILKILNIKLRTADRYIIDFKDSNSKKNYDIKFPYYFTPVDMRIVGVLVGDGNVGKKNKLLRWIQKDINPLKELLYSKISYEVSNNYNKQLVVQQIVIPSFFGKFASSLFNLSLFELGTYKLVKRSLNLPKYYRIALLIAIIEDEGNIDPKNYSGINIRMSDRDVISNLKKLCDSLGYKTSKIIKYKNNLGSHKRNEMYKLNILSDGIFKLGYDILEFEKKFGEKASLWKKRKNFFTRWECCNNVKSRKNRKGRKIHRKIVELFKIHRELSLSQIANKLKLENDRVGGQLKNMYKRGEIERIKHGVYVSKNLSRC